MLLKDFYTHKKTDKIADDHYEAFIHLNKDHSIFKGHFPGNPITPGVCMVQIIKDLTSDIVGTGLRMKESSNIKFMAIINPNETPDLKLSLQLKMNENGTISVKNVSYFDETVALKMSVIYEKI